MAVRKKHKCNQLTMTVY